MTIQPSETKQVTPSPAGLAAGIVVGVAIALIVALPLAAVGAGVGWRVFCMISGAC